MNKSTLAAQPESSALTPSRGVLQRKCACGMHLNTGGQCEDCAAKKGILQRKLMVGASNDPLEEEADRVADQVMSAPVGSLVTRTPVKIQRYTGRVSTAPPSVERVLESPGRPLESALRQDMEARFGHDFSSVRVHTGGEAELSARDVSSKAYTVGHNIVFANGHLAPGTYVGRRLIAHELSHVVQQNSNSVLESPVARGSNNTVERHGLQRSVLMRTLDPRLAALLDEVRTSIPLPLRPEAKAAEILRILARVDLRDPDNLRPVITAIESTFDVTEQGEILAALLTTINTTIPSRTLPLRGPSLQEEAEMQRRLQMLELPHRGPYRQRGPGVVLPVISQPARHLEPAVEAIQDALAGGGAFISGLIEGAGQSLGPQHREQLAARLWQSAILNTIFPPVFVAGAVVGIAEDVIDAVKEIYGLIVDFSSYVQGMRDLLFALFGPDGRQVAHSLGLEIGRGYGARIAELAQSDVFTFTYGVGRMIGPTIVYTILSFLGVPELLVSALIIRLMAVLRPLVQRFPRLIRLLRAVAGRLMRRHTSIDELEQDLARSFAATFTESAGSARPGAPTLVSPELAAGFQAAHLAPLRRLLGRRLRDPQISDLGRIWAAAANEGEIATLTMQNSRRLFNNQRGRFWRRVRQDEAARRIFTDAGFEFPGNPTTAPTRRLADGSVMQATIDHIVERQTDFTRALDPENLRIVTRRENTVLLRQLHAQDPFLSH